MNETIREINCCLAVIDWRASIKAGPEQIEGVITRLDVALGHESGISAGMLAGYDAASSAALEAGLGVLEASGGDVSLILEAIASEFEGLAETVGPLVGDGLSAAYTAEQMAITGEGLGTSLELVDKAAQDWLRNDAMFWIDGHHTNQMGSKIADTVRQVMVENGEDMRAAGAVLQDRLGSTLNKGRAYWEMLAQTATTRARSFGAIQGMVDAGIDVYELINPLDPATSAICRDLNGRTFSVNQAASLRDSMMAADSPDEVKEIMPWVSEPQVRGRSSSDLAAAGVMMPPFHGRCRTTVDVHTEVGQTTQVKTRPGSDVAPDTSKAFGGFSDSELTNKMRPIVENPWRLPAHPDAAKDMDLAMGQSAVLKRSKVFGEWRSDVDGRAYTFWDSDTGVRTQVSETGHVLEVARFEPGQATQQIAVQSHRSIEMVVSPPSDV